MKKAKLRELLAARVKPTVEVVEEKPKKKAKKGDK